MAGPAGNLNAFNLGLTSTPQKMDIHLPLAPKRVSCITRWLGIVAVCAAMTVASDAQTVTTAPVGAMSYDFPANTTTSVGIPLLRSAVYTGVVTAGNATTLTFSDSGLNFSTLIAAGSFYYLEVTGHTDGVTTTAVGDRLEIDEAATTLNANGVLAVDTASNLNTTAGNLSALVGYRVTIRPHWTLATLFGTGTGVTGLNSATTVGGADRVLAWDGSGWSTYWFRQNSAGTIKEWRNTATQTANQDNALVPPGVGVYFRKVAETFTLNVVGEVRTNRFVRNLDNTTQLIALGHPVDRTPAQLGFLPVNNFTAGTTVGAADRILSWDGTGFSTYWLRRNTAGDTIQWRNTATTTTDHSNAGFILANQAFFIRPVGMPNDIVQDTPFTL